MIYSKYGLKIPGIMDAKENSDAHTVDCGPISLTVQSQTEECDLNVLMTRFGLAAKMPENPRIPTYGDFTHITDFRSAIHAVRDAEAAFGEFPAAIRAQFDNDPQNLLLFAADPANALKFKEMFGEKVAPPQPPAVPPTPPGGSTSSTT